MLPDRSRVRRVLVVLVKEARSQKYFFVEFDCFAMNVAKERIAELQSKDGNRAYRPASARTQ